MFSKLKQFKDLRDQAKKMQNVLSQESVTNEKSGIKMTMNGNMEITNLTISEDTSREKIASIVMDLTNSTVKDIQKIMAKKMQEMGGIPGMN